MNESYFNNTIINNGYSGMSLWTLFVTVQTLGVVFSSIRFKINTYNYKTFNFLRKEVLNSNIFSFYNNIDKTEFLKIINGYREKYSFEKDLSYIDKEMLDFFLQEATKNEKLNTIMFKKIKELNEEEVDYIYNLFINKAKEDVMKMNNKDKSKNMIIDF